MLFCWRSACHENLSGLDNYLVHSPYFEVIRAGLIFHIAKFKSTI